MLWLQPIWLQIFNKLIKSEAILYALVATNLVANKLNKSEATYTLGLKS